MSCVQKHDVMNTRNLNIVTQKGTKIGNDNPRISKIKENNDYPNPTKQKKVYNDVSNMFKEFVRQEEIDESCQNTAKELIRLVHDEKSVSQFIDLLYNMKHNNNT